MDNEQFRNLDVARWNQQPRIEWERQEISDYTMTDPPDQNDDGFWPSRDKDAAGYVPPDKFDEELAKAKERMRAWKAGEWGYIGVRAKATIFIPIGGTSYTRYTLASAGVWGVESDSGNDYLAEVFEKEKAELTDAIIKMGKFLLSTDPFYAALAIYRSGDDVELPVLDQLAIIADRIKNDK